ncbi:MAG: hypothetical protein AAF360_18345 [Pseudomonadota bacterium]
MEPTSSAEIQKALAVRLAKRDVGDDVIAKVANRVAKNGLKVGGVDFCPYGICIDYFCDKRLSLDEVLVNEKYRVVRLFPYGILVDDLFRVQVEMQAPELNEIGFRG